MTLEVETKYFNSNRAQWIKNDKEGQWAVVRGDTLLGFYPSLKSGYDAGREEFSEAGFLVKQVTPEDRVETVRRVFWGPRGQQQAV